MQLFTICAKYFSGRLNMCEEDTVSPLFLSASSNSPLMFLLTVSQLHSACVSLTDGRGPGPVALGHAHFPRLSERERVSGQTRHEARHLFLPGQVATSGLEGEGHSVGKAGQQAGQLQVPIAFLV